MPPKTGTLRADRGVATNVSAAILGDRYMQNGYNVNMIKRGVVTSRYRGWSRQRASAFNSGLAFLDFGVFVAGDGTRTLLFQVAGKVYSYDIATSTETQILTGKDTSALPCMRGFAPYTAGTTYTVWCNGVDQPQKITSVSAATALQLNGANYGTGATGAPLAVKTYSKPQFVEPFLDRLVLARFSGAGTQFDVLITNAGTGETCTQSTPLIDTDGGVFTMNPALGPITGLKAFKLSNAINEQMLLVAQAEGITLISGAGATAFQSRILTDAYGVPSNRTWIQMNNDLFFLASDGVRSFSTLYENANLLNSSKTFVVQDLVNRFNKDYLYKAHAFHMRKHQEVVFWFPIDADTDCKNALTFNYNEDANDPIIFPKQGTTVTCSALFKDVPYGGGSDGLLQIHYSGTKYDTAPTAFKIALSLIQPDDPEVNCKLPVVEIVTEGPANKFIPNAFNYVKEVGGKVKRKRMTPLDQPVTVSDAAGTVLDAWVLGVGAYPANHLRFTEYKPIGSGRAFDLELIGNAEDHDIDFVAAHYRLDTGGVKQ